MTRRLARSGESAGLVRAFRWSASFWPRVLAHGVAGRVFAGMVLKLLCSSLGDSLGRDPSPSQRLLLVYLRSRLEGVTWEVEGTLTVRLPEVMVRHQTFWMWPPEGVEPGKGV